MKNIGAFLITSLVAWIILMTVYIYFDNKRDQQPRFETNYKQLIDECMNGKIDMIIGDYVCKPRKDGGVILSPYKRR